MWRSGCMFLLFAATVSQAAIIIPHESLFNSLNVSRKNVENNFLKVRMQLEAPRPQVKRLNLPQGFASNFLMEATNSKKVSEACQVHAMATISNAIDGTTWALKLLDAAGKIPSGILEGNIWWVGSFSECMGIRAKLNFSSNSSQEVSGDFQGQYCTLKALSMFQIAICVPSSCTSDDILQIANKLVPNLQVTLSSPCQKDEDVTFDNTAISVITVFCFFGLLLIIGTVLDGLVILRRYRYGYDGQQNFGLLTKCFLSFSLYTNSVKLFDTTPSKDTITFLHGLRFLSMTWVVLGHSYEFLTMLPLKNIATLADIHSVAFQAVENATFSVDTFFFLSGFLVAYGMLKKLSEPGAKFNIFKFYLHRYWRLTPVYAMVIAWAAGFWYLMAKGPLWPNYINLQDDCRVYWWRNLLYIQTFFDDLHNCVPVAWYLACDMQMYIISPLIVYFLCRRPRIGLISWSCFLVMTLLSTGILTGLNGYPGFLVLANTDMVKLMDMFVNVYMRFYCRMGPYLIGIITAYILHKKRGTLRIPLPYVLSGWMSATAIAALIIYGPYPYFSGEREIGTAINIIYATFARTVWALSLAWLTCACFGNHGGVVKSVLSWKVFIPLSRLTYCLYLVHLYTIFYFFGTRQNEFYFDHYFAVYCFLASLGLSLGVAFIFSMMFEAPMLQLEKIFLGLRERHSESRENLSVNPVLLGTEDANEVTG